MATLGTSVLTLSDWAKLRDPDGKTARVVEMLKQKNQILDDALFIEGNLPTGHRTTVRTGLPTPTWRLLNQGVASSKGTTAQITETCGMLEDWSEIDVDLANLGGDPEGVRLSEAVGHIEGISQEMAGTLWYGNSGTAPEEFTGLAPRYSLLSAANGQNIVDAGGTGSDNSSIWLVNWSKDGVCMTFPNGSKAGILHEDLGVETVETTAGIAGNRMRAYRDRWQWKAGLVLKDWREVVRIANIDISLLIANAGMAILHNQLIKAYHRIVGTMNKPAIYMNRTTYQMFDIQSRDAVSTGGQLKYEVVEGKPLMTWRGIPLKISDQLTETEARVV
jgi:hypothetical protein